MQVLLPFEMMKEILKFQTTWWLKKNMELVYIETLSQIPRLVISNFYSYVDLKISDSKKYTVYYYAGSAISRHSFCCTEFNPPFFLLS